MKLALTAKLKHGVLYEFMQQMGWNQAEFARQLGIGATQMSAYLTLKKTMSAAMAKRIAAFIGCSPEALRPTADEQAALQQFPRELAVIRDVPLIEWQNKHPCVPGPETTYDAHEQRAVLTTLLETLSPKYAKVLALRFGLDGEGERTIQEVAEFFGFSRERARQMESIALQKLRRSKHVGLAREVTERE